MGHEVHFNNKALRGILTLDFRLIALIFDGTVEKVLFRELIGRKLRNVNDWYSLLWVDVKRRIIPLLFGRKLV